MVFNGLKNSILSWVVHLQGIEIHKWFFKETQAAPSGSQIITKNVFSSFVPYTIELADFTSGTLNLEYEVPWGKAS